jgi:hypothetical protein
VEPRFHGAQLDAQDLGGLLQRQPVEVVQDHDALVLLGQLSDPLADDLAELRLLGPLGGQRAGRRGRCARRSRRSATRRGAAVTGANNTGSATRGAATAAARHRHGTCGDAGRHAQTCPAGSLPQPADRRSGRTPSDRSGCGSGRRTPRRRRDRRPGHGAAAPHHSSGWPSTQRLPQRRSSPILRAQVLAPGPSLTDTIQGVALKGSVAVPYVACGAEGCRVGNPTGFRRMRLPG